MPSSTMIIKSSDGNLQYANLHWDAFYNESVEVTNNGIHYASTGSPTVTTDNGATYADNTLTLPITINGFATEANATTPTYNVGDSIPLTVGTQTLYATRATMKSYDLSTSTKWDSLSAGNHSVTIIAKASGYRDSASSIAVTVVKSSPSETWVLSPSYSGTSHDFTGLSFISNSETFSRIQIAADFSGNKLYYDDKYIAYIQDDDYVDWQVGDVYKTLIFQTAPTGDLLTWLQANGTKQ